GVVMMRNIRQKVAAIARAISSAACAPPSGARAIPPAPISTSSISAPEARKPRGITTVAIHSRSGTRAPRKVKARMAKLTSTAPGHGGKTSAKARKPKQISAFSDTARCRQWFKLAARSSVPIDISGLAVAAHLVLFAAAGPTNGIADHQSAKCGLQREEQAF